MNYFIDLYRPVVQNNYKDDYSNRNEILDVQRHWYVRESINNKQIDRPA